ncbi:Sec-independent protein translocase subunit TatA/TatB [Engelhardtia mirabilis]|uniref:Sec-independent protein translocase subunit TatA/TatB n=1 Tax=Engelhardtia mirabilis TaxID=2528011 RepID=UPI003AF37FF9
MLAFIQNINPTELLLIAVVAVLIFGRRLPEVAGQVAGRVQQARRAFNDLKRETGIDEEMRRARRNFESAIHDAKFSAERDPAAPRIQPPSSGGAVGRSAASGTRGDLPGGLEDPAGRGIERGILDPNGPQGGTTVIDPRDMDNRGRANDRVGDKLEEPAVPPPGGPDDGPHGGSEDSSSEESGDDGDLASRP